MTADALSGPSGLLDSWLANLLVPVFFPSSSSLIVRTISGVFAALGFAFIAPIIALVLFDFGLWVWRLYVLNRNAFLRQRQQEHERQRRRQQLRSEQRKEQQTRREAPDEAISTSASR